ncbi:MAG: ankyrin repeat domain-containing protein, partial [Thermodesulfobacteriota bacterium]
APPSSPGGAAAPAAERNLAMGTGEARNPEPFTRERRLLDAVQRNDRATIERALELGVPVDAKDDLGRSALLLAASDAGDLELVRFLHAKGAAVDEPDVQGRAALSHAAAEGRVEIVRWLVDNGAEVDRPDWQQRTPLFHAALRDQTAVVALLLDRGADPNVRDQFGDTPLIVACAKGNADTAALLVARGADPSLEDQEGRTASERSAPGVEACRPRTPA